ncbi:acetyl-CoA carboxylase biotin carboxylase subunit family protein [Marinobacter sp.]|uniref:ATP-grasp domain-containing protein n=1 Tax=Marinobacter sp. TaxID=50741 RepID=UPI00384C630F
MDQRQKNIFILGYDERHGQDVRKIPDADAFCFHPLLDADEVIHQKNFYIDDKLEKARDVLRSFDGTVDGIICHWDFPATSMAAILCAEFGLLSPSLEAVLKCSHKYWSRLEQQAVVPEATPGFCAVDPFDENAPDKITLDYPFWIKPIKGYGSTLGFRINNRRELDHALDVIKERIKRIGDPFNRILEKADLPPELGGVDGNYLIAEKLVHGWEFAPEGYIQHGEFHVHGVIDMVRDKNRKSFLRYEYPSQAPRRIQDRGIAMAEKVLRQIGFDNGCFNMEFFWDEDSDDLWIIEINPRISQSHCYQFEMVDGMSNHEIAVHVALGDSPQFQHRSGPYRHAAKFLLRHYTQQDAVVDRAPNDEEISRLAELQPDTEVVFKAQEGMRLSEIPDQDPYSYILAEVHVAGKTQHEMVKRYHEALEWLPFEFSPVPDDEET